MTVEEFFDGRPVARSLYEAVQAAVGDVAPEVSASQIAFRSAHTFAAVWTPDRYLRGETAPLVLSLYLRRRIASPRFKQVAEPAPGRFTHHLELREPAEVDAEVVGWLREAAAGG